MRFSKKETLQLLLKQYVVRKRKNWLLIVEPQSTKRV